MTYTGGEVAEALTQWRIRAGTCATPHTCQFGFYWGLSIVPGASSVGVTVGTQTSALDASIAARSEAR